MADSKLADLTENTAPAITDLVYLVADPAGTPVDRKVTVANLRNRQSARLYRTANQTISNATWTSIQFDNEAHDDGGFHDNATNNTRLTIAVAGTFIVGSRVVWASNVTGSRFHRYYLNGTDEISGDFAVGSAQADLGIPTLYKFAANDYVELQVHQTSGGNLNVTGGSGVSLFWIVRVA